jgi:hypothetical protein
MTVRGGPKEWMQFLHSRGTKVEKNKKIENLLNFRWQMRKERNRKIFYLKELSPIRVANITKEAINMFTGARSDGG